MHIECLESVHTDQYSLSCKKQKQMKFLMHFSLFVCINFHAAQAHKGKVVHVSQFEMTIHKVCVAKS